MSETEVWNRTHDVLFVVPHYADAERLNKELPDNCMAIAPGSALTGRAFETIIVLRSESTWGPEVLAWNREHEADWFDSCVRTRLRPGGELI